MTRFRSHAEFARAVEHADRAAYRHEIYPSCETRISDVRLAYPIHQDRGDRPSEYEKRLMCELAGLPALPVTGLPWRFAFCRGCGRDVKWVAGLGGAMWTHTETGDARCV